jgi:hypothetical protein
VTAPSESAADRGRAAYVHLVQVHLLYRRQLASLRAAIDAWSAGGDPAQVQLAAGHLSGTGQPDELRAHCLQFCQALQEHHRFEDAAMFPDLQRARPDAGAVLDLLRAAHHRISELLIGVADTVQLLPVDPGSASTALARLADELTAHLDDEERSLAPLFGALPA